MFKFIVIFCLVGFAVAQEDCDTLAEGADKCAKEVLYKYLTENIPDSLQEVTDKCAEAKKQLLCAKKYRNQCVKKLPGTMFNILLRNALKLLKKNCNTEEKKTEFLEHVKCLKQENPPQVLELLKKFQIYQIYVANIKDDNDLLPGFCCGMYVLSRSTKDEFNKKCRETGISSDSTAKYFIEEFDKNTKEIGDLFCKKFDAEEYCNGRYLSMLNAIKNITTSPVNYDLYTNKFLTPLIAMAERMTAA